ncbi:MAG: protein translocase subunit SecF [Bacillota bacterium]
MNILGKRKLFYAISLAVIMAGMAGLVFNGGLNLGIDFKSGTIIEVDLKEPFTVDEIGQVLEPFAVGNSSIRAIGDAGTEAEIRTENLTEEKLTEVLAGLRSRWPEMENQIPATVDPLFSVELVKQALLALSVAAVGMVLYISWRFEFKFAISAIIALLHDVTIVLGFFAVFRVEVNSEFIAAILTIVGYSINDTIVVFDRIRENMKTAKRQGDIEGLANQSVLQSIPRCLKTSVTTVLAIGAVLAFGGATLKPLSTALVVGMIAGTYSSIFIASSLWLDLKRSSRRA